MSFVHLAFSNRAHSINAFWSLRFLRGVSGGWGAQKSSGFIKREKVKKPE
jgi:hypothetical protein